MKIWWTIRRRALLLEEPTVRTGSRLVRREFVRIMTRHISSYLHLGLTALLRKPARCWLRTDEEPAPVVLAANRRS